MIDGNSYLKYIRCDRYLGWRSRDRKSKNSFEEFASYYDKDWIEGCLAEWEASKCLNALKHIDTALEDIFNKQYPDFFSRIPNISDINRMENEKKYISEREAAEVRSALQAKNCIFSEVKFILTEVLGFVDFPLFNDFVYEYYDCVGKYGGHSGASLISAMSKHEKEAVNKYLELGAAYENKMKNFAKFVFRYCKTDNISVETYTSAESIEKFLLKHTINLGDACSLSYELYKIFEQNEKAKKEGSNYV